ncbi:MAG: SDR family NAD(P)-dependent oxidoreductase [Armatimonadota bacterium]
MHLSDAVAIVTGAARGIGRAIAEAYASCGARVALADVLAHEARATAVEIQRAGGTALAVRCDVTARAEVEDMVTQVRERLGPVDILVNNAGSLSVLGPVWEADPERWLRDLMVNLYGTFLCSRAVLPGMIERRGGYLINLVGAGVDPPHLYTTGYDASKAGVVRLTEALAQEAAEYGVKAFAMMPGTVRTAMTEFIADSPEGRRWRPSFRSIFEQGRDAPPDLAADLAVRLVSGAADALSGRYFRATEDLDEVIAQTDQILADNLRVLRLR